MAGRPARLTPGEIASKLSGSQKGLSFQDLSSGGTAPGQPPGRSQAQEGQLLSRRRAGLRRVEGTHLLLDSGRRSGKGPKAEKEATQMRTLHPPLAPGPPARVVGWGEHRPPHTKEP